MNLKLEIAGAALVLAAPIQSLQAAEAMRFTMDEYGWEMEQAAERCVARAQFVSDDDRARLELSRTSDQSPLRAAVIGTGIHFAGREGGTRIFAQQEPIPVVEAQPLSSGEVEGARFDLVFLRSSPDESRVEPSSRSLADLRREERELLARSDGIYIDGLFSEALVLETGSLANMMALMHGCTDRLVASWGLDPEQQRNLSRRATPRNIRELSRLLEAFHTGPRATTANFDLDLILVIDEGGDITNCKVIPADAPVNSSGACRELRRHGHFEPARDESGAAVESYIGIGFSARSL